MNPATNTSADGLADELASSSALPRVVRDCETMWKAVRSAQSGGKCVGVVMTMGALHEGHLSLVERSCRECDLTIVTVFVNPTQFLPGEDFQKYPRQLEKDVAALQAIGPSIVFAPSTAEMYPLGGSTEIKPPDVADRWEGEHRPKHYDGVCTIVCKLFHVIPANRAYFGSKDYQQFLVIRRMAADLRMAVNVIPCPIVRDEDGLALSSRNRYLSSEERAQALSISRGLRLASAAVEAGETDAAILVTKIRQELGEAGIQQIDYVAIANPETLAEVAIVREPAIALIAAQVGNTRLIDNLLLRPTRG